MPDTVLDAWEIVNKTKKKKNNSTMVLSSETDKK